MAVVGAYNTKQARVLEGEDPMTVTLDAIRGVLNDAGLSPKDIDGISAAVGIPSGIGGNGGQLGA